MEHKKFKIWIFDLVCNGYEYSNLQSADEFNFLCMDLTFIYALLNKGYGLSDDKFINVSLKKNQLKQYNIPSAGEQPPTPKKVSDSPKPTSIKQPQSLKTEVDKKSEKAKNK